MRKKTILYRGSRERLHRMVRNYGGTPNQTGRFSLLWKPDHYQQHLTLSFRIRCSAAKTEAGWRITYRILPTGGTILRLGLFLGVLIWILLKYFPGSGFGEYAAMAFLMISGLLAAWWQLRDSEREFRKRFTTPTA